MPYIIVDEDDNGAPIMIENKFIQSYTDYMSLENENIEHNQTVIGINPDDNSIVRIPQGKNTVAKNVGFRYVLVK